MRPSNWLKGVFVVLPLVFSSELFNASRLRSVLFATMGFCLVSSAVYTVNDIRDRDLDARHPEKSHRPVASGAITVGKASILAVFLLTAGMTLAFLSNMVVAAICGVYLMLNLLYSLCLKDIPIVDCFCIAAGFVLRVYAGGFACGEPVSDWLFLTITAMSLFMSFGKRRGEFVNATNTARTANGHYSLEFLNGMIYASAALAVVFYSLWAMGRGLNMVYTVPMVIFIASRYLLLISARGSHGDPTTVILGDKTLLLSLALYLAATVAVLYLGLTP